MHHHHQHTHSSSSTTKQLVGQTNHDTSNNKQSTQHKVARPSETTKSERISEFVNPSSLNTSISSQSSIEQLSHSSFISSSISQYIQSNIIEPYQEDIQLCLNPCEKIPFYIIYSNSRKLMKNCANFISHLYEMELKEKKLNHLICKNNLIPIGFDAEYKAKIGVGVCNDIKHLISQKYHITTTTMSNNTTTMSTKNNNNTENNITSMMNNKSPITTSTPLIIENIIDLAIVSSQYHLFGTSIPSLKLLGIELLNIENVRGKDLSKFEPFVKYAAMDAFIGYSCLYKLYEIMSSEDFSEWIRKQCKSSDDPSFDVISNHGETSTAATTTTTKDFNNSTEDSSSSHILLKGKSLTSLMELSKLNPNATDQEREEFLSMRSTFMGMMYGDKRSHVNSTTRTTPNQQVLYAKEKNQARLRKMAHKNSTQRSISNLVNDMKQSKQSATQTMSQTSDHKTEFDKTQSDPSNHTCITPSSKQESKKRSQPSPTSKKSNPPPKSKKVISSSQDSISFSLV
ncbi:hypothetical protein C9374_011320 [Naegleria lovaniensis]|uniref:Uncharacterized protein n=1 Tax=Naegleria lovaniensis TaxID=51637 RepID=A0AA88H0H6_NAELO|nr:uncharacterized protein C9374_011320 [Naegleria lovaniensis]KAG2392595.1 hypothetical protein C9374_011320 [Naegleria lovaniensis]